MDQHVGSELPPINPENPTAQYSSLAVETANSVDRNEQQASQAVETAAPSTPPPASVQQSLYQQTVPAQTVPLPISDDGSMPMIADDTDLIEKEWVLKAKQIVEQTKHDPYQQNKEVEKIKADYMKKRYNKDIRLTED